MKKDNPILFVVNIPFLKREDANKIADQLINEGFALIRVEQMFGNEYERRHHDSEIMG